MLRSPSKLEETLEFVRANIPFYVALNGANRIEDLRDFPILTSEMLRENFHSLYHLDAFPDFLASSGGTSGTFPKLFFRNYHELEQSSKELSQMQSSKPRLSRVGTGFTLNLTDFQHGLTMPPRHGQSVLSIPLESGRQLKIVAKLMSEGLRIGDQIVYPSRIVGSATKLRALTAFCESIADGIDFHIHEIISTSFYCSLYWMKRFREYWQADVRVAYGLSEFPEVTTIQCPQCGLYHLPPTVHSEVLELEANTRASDGMGRLVLTSLLPYRRAMPLIRYDTGDIVAIQSTPDCEAGDLGYSFFGRREQVLLDPETSKVLLSPFEVIDVLEEMLSEDLVRQPEIARSMTVSGTSAKPDYSLIGYSAVRIRSEKKETGQRLSIMVECHHPSRACEREVSDRLCETVDSKLDQTSNTVCVSLLPPGGIQDTGLDYTLV